jgi:poly(A) polymerase
MRNPHYAIHYAVRIFTAMNASKKLETATRIVRRLAKSGHTAYFAGGAVRDMLLGGEIEADIDIATSATPDTISRLFRRVIGVMLVVEDEIPFEVATFRADIGGADGRHPERVEFSDARSDAQRRDFTINGLFFDPLENRILDFVGGRQDLKNGLIRAIGRPEERFDEDYLRLLRAVRFSARFDFAVESRTWEAIRQAAAGIRNISAERIFQELSRMLTGPRPDKAVTLLNQTGLLAIVLPEVQALEGVEQPPEFHPEGDVFEHTLLALSFLRNPSQTLGWSTLLHDIGKPPTMTRADRIRFNNHHRVGALMAREVLRRLKAPRALIEQVFECIDNHMNFMNVRKMRLSTLKRFLARATLEDELQLHRADCLASHGDIENYTFLRQKQQEFALEQVRPDPLLSGRDLIALGYTPGPVFGRILAAAYDLQLEEQLHTPEEARAWAKRHGNEFL